MTDVLLKNDGVRYIPRNKFFGYLFNHKPFNCGICLSFWTGLILSVCLNEILFLSLPLLYHALKKYL